MDWFLYDRDLGHERVKYSLFRWKGSYTPARPRQTIPKTVIKFFLLLTLINLKGNLI